MLTSKGERPQGYGKEKKRKISSEPYFSEIVKWGNKRPRGIKIVTGDGRDVNFHKLAAEKKQAC